MARLSLLCYCDVSVALLLVVMVVFARSITTAII
jgi:hypothetical protein